MVALLRREPRSYEEPGPAYDVLSTEGRTIGTVYRTRHTYRTTYLPTSGMAWYCGGERIGYDRSHLCWWGSAYGNPEKPHGETFRCHRTRAEVVALVEGS